MIGHREINIWWKLSKEDGKKRPNIVRKDFAGLSKLLERSAVTRQMPYEQTNVWISFYTIQVSKLTCEENKSESANLVYDQVFVHSC